MWHTCGLRGSGETVCWGDNGHGQTDAPSGRFSAVGAGWGYSCGLRHEGDVICWGDISADDVPVRLRTAGLPAAGTGGLLDSSSSATEAGLAALAALGVSTLSLLTLAARRRNRA